MSEFLARAYRRAPGLYLVWVVVLVVAFVEFYVALAIWIYGHYLGISSSETWHLLFWTEAAILAGSSVASWGAVRHAPAVRDWVWGRAGADRAVEVWTELAGLPGSLVLRYEICIAVVVAPALVLGAPVSVRTDAMATAVLFAGMLTVQVACGFAARIVFDIAVRPVRVAVDPALPRDFEPNRSSGRMTRRTAAEIATMIMPAAMLTAAAEAPAGEGAAALARSFAVAGAVTALLAFLVGAVLVERVTGPVRELLAGTRAVTTGDFTTRVPLASTDDHLVLSGSFNTMVTGLRERAALQSALGVYLDPAIAQRILVEGAHIAGEAADVTVMFIDIVGYTSMAEATEPADVVAELNEFFELVIPVIVELDGHANKLLGDGLMAVFGVPVPHIDHADRALTAARAIECRLAERYNGTLRVGMGLHSGTVVVGSMGGGPKLDYTIIGDVVNVAARIEAWTRTTGDAILLSSDTRARLADPGGMTSRGHQALKGRAATVELWSIPTTGATA